MRPWVRRHRWLCGWMAAVLLFAQTAAVAYACAPRTAVLLGHGPALAAAAEAPPCAEHAAAAEPGADAHPLLCKAHCESDEQSVNNGSGAFDPPSVIDLGIVSWCVPEVAAAAPVAARAARPGGAGPPASAIPLYLALLVLRN